MPLIAVAAVTVPADTPQQKSRQAASAPADQQLVDFGRDIQPLLSDRCYLCHGPDEAARQAGLRLDTFEDATESSIVPGDADRSAIIARMSSTDDDYRMPTPKSHKTPLTPDQIDLFRKWINQGAKYEGHWAFENPVKPDVPKPIEQGDNVHPVDAFVQRKLTNKGMTIAKIADRATRLRRASFDLTGLPPTPEQVQTFVADSSPDQNAWSGALDHLMESPHYGEHQARLWLDASRYADSNGYQYDFKRDQWAWRDWVINAFNNNQPFDQFSVEQLAGDLLPDGTEQQRLATGFCRNHPITVEGGIIDEEYRTEYVIDRTVTAGTVWMGLTVQCARCHDHKYDPLSQKDFFQLTAFFNNVPEKGFNGFEPKARIPSPMQTKTVSKAKADVEIAETGFRRLASSWQVDRTKLLKDFSVANAKVDTPVPAAKSLGGATMEVLEDNSILVSGKKENSDVYDIVLATKMTPINSIRVDVLKHKSLPLGGVSRSENANFVMSEIELAFAPAGRDEFENIKLVHAEADYSQNRNEVAYAIDGELDENGWAVAGNIPKHRTDHHAVFSAASSFGDAASGKVRVRMHFASPYKHHQLGRFKITLLAGETSAEVKLALAAAEKAVDQHSDAERDAITELLARKHGNTKLKKALESMQRARRKYRAVMASVPATMVMADQEKRRKTFVLQRGEYDKPAAEVQPLVPEWLNTADEKFRQDRLGFAKWLMSDQNPLTARVTVNRYWQQLFGIGIVDTPEDFGLQGSRPTHPDLLDWLAVDFRENGWDVKRLLKQIMMSQTYQQDSAMTAEQFSVDPENRLLARGPRFRLDAESIRDAALSVSGALNRTIGGPSVFPYHPRGLWLEVNNRPGYSSKYEQDSGQKLYRRSVYTFWKRSVAPPSMAIFDAPSREYCQVRRSRTNTPLQAFVMLHDPQFVEAARLLATRMLESDGGTESQIKTGMNRALGRSPTDAELTLLNDAYYERFKACQADPELAKNALAVGDSEVAPSLDTIQLAAMMDVARLMLNLSEFVTRE